MKHKSKKKRGKNKKSNMKSPFVITIVILALFAILVIFSIVKGPVEKEDVTNINDNIYLDDTEIINDIKEEMGKTGESSSVKTNKAILSGDINTCEGDETCEFSFIVNKAKKAADTEVCNELTSASRIENCKDNVLFSKVIQTSNKELCTQIKDINIKRSCEEL